MTPFLFSAGGNTKNISLGALDEFMDWKINQQSGAGDIGKVDQCVADVFRGVTLRGLGVSSLPFRIESANGTTLTTSGNEYEDVTKLLPKPKRLFELLEHSRTLTGTFYLYRYYNRVVTTKIEYIPPQAVLPKYVNNIYGGTLEAWQVSTANGIKIIPLYDIVHCWMPDGLVGNAPPKRYPGAAALAAGNAQMNADEFIAWFYRRGAIRATVFTTEGNPPKTELDRMESWLNSWFGGIGNAFRSKFFPVGKVNPIVIGDGLKDLNNSELDKSNSRKIAKALGIPMAIFDSESSAGLGGGGVASQDEINFLNQCLIPEFDAILEVLNDEIFVPMGFRIIAEYEKLDAFHVDEKELASTMDSYLNTYAKCKTFEEWEAFAEMTGVEYDVPKFRALFAMKETRREETQSQLNEPAPADMTVTKPEPKQLTEGDSVKALERKQFKAWAAKRDASEWHKFQFKHLGIAEQNELLKKKNLKSVDAAARQFCARWKERIKRAFQDDTSNLEADMREILEYHVGAVYFEGLQEAGIPPEDFTADDSQAADDLIALQMEHLPDFVSDVLDAVENVDAREGILSRAELWCNAVQQIGNNARNAALDGMFEFVLVGEESEESCETCQRLLGKKHRWSWIEKNGYIVQAGNDRFECGCYRCPHNWEPVKR